MRISRRGSVIWRGGFKDGGGAVSTESGALQNYPYGYSSRFEGVKGTNPEELVAAGLASCFTMSVAAVLTATKFIASHMETSATITLEGRDGGYVISSAHLTFEAKIPDIGKDEFEKLVEAAKVGCPVSNLLKVEVTVKAALLT